MTDGSVNLEALITSVKEFQADRGRDQKFIIELDSELPEFQKKYNIPGLTVKLLSHAYIEVLRDLERSQPHISNMSITTTNGGNWLLVTYKLHLVASKEA